MFGMTRWWVNNAINVIFRSIVPLKRPHFCLSSLQGRPWWKRVKRYLDALFRSGARTLMSTAGRCQPRALPAFTTSSSPVCFWLRGWKWSKGQRCFHGNNLSWHMCVWVSFRCDVHSLMWCLAHTNTHTCTYFNHVGISLETVNQCYFTVIIVLLIFWIIFYSNLFSFFNFS